MIYQGAGISKDGMKPTEVRGEAHISPEFTMSGFSHRDVGVIKEITRRSLGEEYPPSLFMDIHGWWPDGFIVVKQRGEILGFVAGVVSAPRRARVLMLAVQDGYRGRGLGTALMDEFTRRCVARGISSIELEVRVSNEGAIRFYKRLGYTIRYLLPRFYTDKEDGYKMWKDLR